MKRLCFKEFSHLDDVAVVVQARVKSKRFPNKVFFPLNGEHILEHLIKRLLFSGLKTVLAVPSSELHLFEAFAQKKGIGLYGGSEDNVLERYYRGAKTYELQTIIRVTADNPLTSLWGIFTCLEFHRQQKNDLSFVVGLPYGAGCEVFQRDALEHAWKEATHPLEKEHPTQYFYRHPRAFKISSRKADLLHWASALRVSIDTRADFERYRAWVNGLGLNKQGFLPLRKVIQYAYLF